VLPSFQLLLAGSPVERAAETKMRALNQALLNSHSRGRSLHGKEERKDSALSADENLPALLPRRLNRRQVVSSAGQHQHGI
jgi:hypothetical protein